MEYYKKMQQNDRKEKSGEEVKASHANQLKYGANMVKFTPPEPKKGGWGWARPSTDGHVDSEKRTSLSLLHGSENVDHVFGAGRVQVGWVDLWLSSQRLLLKLVIEKKTRADNILCLCSSQPSNHTEKVGMC